MDRGLPPNPQLSDEEYDKSFMRIFKHCIDIHKSSLKLDDYNFIRSSLKTKKVIP